MPRPGEEGLGSLAQPADRRPQLRRGAPQPPGRARLAGQGILLGLPEGGPDLQQLGHGMGRSLAELVGRPGADRGPAQGRHPTGGLAVPGGPELAGQLVPAGHELGQRQPVQTSDSVLDLDLCRHRASGPPCA
jgi:hypothetical protein